jgi:hypothetical protein
MICSGSLIPSAPACCLLTPLAVLLQAVFVLIELQTKKESKNSNFQLTALEKKTLTFLEERISGMSANMGLCCDIDPLFQKLLLDFTDKAEAATLTSLTKAIGASSGNGGGGGGKQKKKVGGPKPKATAGAKLNVKIDTAGGGRG